MGSLLLLLAVATEILPDLSSSNSRNVSTPQPNMSSRQYTKSTPITLLAIFLVFALFNPIY